MGGPPGVGVARAPWGREARPCGLAGRSREDLCAEQDSQPGSRCRSGVRLSCGQGQPRLAGSAHPQGGLLGRTSEFPRAAPRPATGQRVREAGSAGTRLVEWYRRAEGPVPAQAWGPGTPRHPQSPRLRASSSAVRPSRGSVGASQVLPRFRPSHWVPALREPASLRSPAGSTRARDRTLPAHCRAAALLPRGSPGD